MSDMTKLTNQIEGLIKKAADADKPDDAMKFAQAALNASQVLYALRDLTTPKET